MAFIRLTSSSMPSPVMQLVNTNGFPGAHQLRVVVHHLKRRMHVGRKVGLVDYENVTLRYSGTVLAGNLVAGGPSMT